MHKYTQYFKDSGGFDRFIKGLYKKYKSLGRISGFIKLNNITTKEATSFSRFFGYVYDEGSDIKISISRFLNIMKLSRFEDFNVYKLISEYLEVELFTNKEDNLSRQTEERKFFHDISSQHKIEFIDKLIEAGTTTGKILHQRYNKNKDALKMELDNIIGLIKKVPTEKKLLSLYSSSITKNPHFLDLDTQESNLFISFLADLNELEIPKNRFEKIKFLDKFNLEVDNVSNYVITYNLMSNRECINEFSRNKEPLILTMVNILKTNEFGCIDDEVYIFENPSILAEVMGKQINKTIIITNGFINMSVYLLLDKLQLIGVKMFYNGDFDPEGLIIADKLKKQYGDSLKLICYDTSDYMRCISDNLINDSRISKLKMIDSNELFDVKNEIESRKMAGYQESNKDRLLEYLTKKDG